MMLSWLHSFLFRENPMMDYRKMELINAYNGLKEFGISLVSYKDNNIYPSGLSDDLLLYAIGPWMAKILNLDVKQATDLFFNASILISIGIVIFTLLITYKSYLSKILTVLIFITIFKRIINLGYIEDIYRIGVITTLSITPLFFFFQKNKNPESITYKVFLIFCGFMIMFSHYLRSFSSIPILFLIIWFIVFQKSIFYKKFILISCLIIGMLIPIISFKHMIHERNLFVKTHVAGFNPDIIRDSHTTWHTVYVGFGVYPNSYGLEFNDTVAYVKAQSLKPDVVYASKEYEQIMKLVVFNFVRDHFIFVVKITIKKFISGLGYAKLFGWLGILLFLLLNKRPMQNVGIIISLCLALLPGIVAVPRSGYLSTFIALSKICAVFGYGQLFEFFFNYRKSFRWKFLKV